LVVAAVLLVPLGALGALALLQVARAAPLATAARTSLISARDATNDGQLDQARTHLASASTAAGAADSHLRSIAPRLLGQIPIAGRPVRSAEMLVRATAQASSAAHDALDVFPEHSPWAGGALNVASLVKMRQGAVRADAGLTGALRLARRSPGWPLPGSVSRARRELIGQLSKQGSTVTSARRVLDVLPEIVGANGHRRYFVAFQNPTEMRGTGGFWGSHAFLDADDGRMDLGGFGRPARDLNQFATTRGPAWYEARYGSLGGSHDWRQLSMAPDFPTVAGLAERNLAGATGIGPVDGVIAIDPVGLAALLRLTGPVTVVGWPERIDADNVVRITLHDVYRAFAGDTDQRVDFLTEVAQATWAALKRTDIPMRPNALRGLGDAVAAHRFIFHMTSSAEQHAIASVDADGALKGTDTFGLVTQNTAPSKMDYWLERRVSLTFRLRDDESADVTGTVVVRNGGNGAGEPAYIAGPNGDNPLVPAGWNQQSVSLYAPNRVTDDARDGDVPVGAEEEPGFVTASTYLDIAPLSEAVMRTHFRVASIWDAKSRTMRVKFRRQPSIAPDNLRFEVVPPRGWSIVGHSIMRVALDRDVVMTFKLSHN
jgi:hypothetical protein